MSKPIDGLVPFENETLAEVKARLELRGLVEDYADLWLEYHLRNTLRPMLREIVADVMSFAKDGRPMEALRAEVAIMAEEQAHTCRPTYADRGRFQ